MSTVFLGVDVRDTFEVKSDKPVVWETAIFANGIEGRMTHMEQFGGNRKDAQNNHFRIVRELRKGNISLN